MVVEQAGGRAVATPRIDQPADARTGRRILEIQPSSIHERISLVIGSPHEVDRVMGYW